MAGEREAGDTADTNRGRILYGALHVTLASTDHRNFVSLLRRVAYCLIEQYGCRGIVRPVKLIDKDDFVRADCRWHAIPYPNKGVADLG